MADFKTFAPPAYETLATTPRNALADLARRAAEVGQWQQASRASAQQSGAEQQQRMNVQVADSWARSNQPAGVEATPGAFHRQQMLRYLATQYPGAAEADLQAMIDAHLGQGG